MHQPRLYGSLVTSGGVIRLHEVCDGRGNRGLRCHFPLPKGDPPGWPLIGELLLGRPAEEDRSVSDRAARVEAVLFLAGEPIPSRKLAKLANLDDGSEARSLIRELQTRYDAQGRAFQIEEVAGGFQMRTRPAYAPWIRKLAAEGMGPLNLSPPALETLAIVAYRQPVLRAEVEAIRGVACDEILRQLMDRELLRIVGRSSELGRPLLYGTTRRFLEVFGLKSLDDLPRARQLAHLGVSPAGEDEGRRAEETRNKPSV